MTDVTLNSKDDNEVVFSLEMTGIPKDENRRVTFVVDKDDYCLMFPCDEEKGEENTWVAKIPSMDTSGRLKGGTYPYSIEVVNGNYFFKPLTGELEVVEGNDVKGKLVAVNGEMKKDEPEDEKEDDKKDDKEDEKEEIKTTEESTEEEEKSEEVDEAHEVKSAVVVKDKGILDILFKNQVSKQKDNPKDDDKFSEAERIANKLLAKKGAKEVKTDPAPDMVPENDKSAHVKKILESAKIRKKKVTTSKIKKRGDVVIH